MKMEINEIDFRENTACGGKVRYTINPDTDMITYTHFSNCKAGIVCKDCRGWQTLCPAFQALKEWIARTH